MVQVIGAGLSRTGTMSLRRALEILGYNPAYHFLEHGRLSLDFWERVYSGEVEVGAFASEYTGVQAVTDLPAAYFFQEFLAAFPDAKVILTVRDDEEKWYNSLVPLLQSILSYPTSLTFVSRWNYRFIRLMKQVFMTVYGGNNPNICKRRYREHNEYIKAVVPAAQLLVFNVKEGWKPLCDFLGKDIPEEPFPRLNSGQSPTRKLDMAKRGAMRAYFCYFCVLSCASAVVSFAVRKFIKF